MGWSTDPTKPALVETWILDWIGRVMAGLIRIIVGSCKSGDEPAH